MAGKATTKGQGPAYVPTALPTTAVQYRHCSGATGTVQATAYVQACRTLAAWGKGAGHAPLVHALVHLGWCTGSGARATVQASGSAAWRHGKAHLQVGAPAAPQVCATLAALAGHGAPAAALATVWATYTGQA